MDDWIVIAPSRWKLRTAVGIVNKTLNLLKVEQHPDKTFIGRIDKGFSFLGYQINKAGLTGVAPPTRERFVERVNQLYEQGADGGRIGDYVRRWLVWVRSGLVSRSDNNQIDFTRFVLICNDGQPSITLLRRPRG